MEYYIEKEKQTPILEADVFVAGAGTAGCIAAIAAARAGSSVILVEKLPVPGGTYTNGGIGANSFYSMTQDLSKAKRTVGGIPYELNEKLVEAYGGTGYVPTPEDHHHSPYRFVADHEIYKGVVSRMLMEAGVKVLLQTFFCGVEMDGTSIVCAFIENKSGRFAVKAKAYIDCTGDGDVAKRAGCRQVPLWQDYDKVCGGPTGLVFGMAGVDTDRFVKENPLGAVKLSSHDTGINGIKAEQYAFTQVRDKEKYKAVVDLGMRAFTSMTSIHQGEMTYINNSKGVMCDGSDAESLSKAEMEMRIRIMDFASALKSSVPGFEESYMSWAAVQLGVRASHITICDHMITQEEISAATRFEDEIGLYGFHDLMKEGNPECKIKEPGFYGFPYRMLLPLGVDNLFMAGRCVTLDIKAHMSTRNCPGCQLMGQGAGVAAALIAANGLKSRDLDYPLLRKALIGQGVILD